MIHGTKKSKIVSVDEEAAGLSGNDLPTRRGDVLHDPVNVKKVPFETLVEKGTFKNSDI